MTPNRRPGLSAAPSTPEALQRAAAALWQHRAPALACLALTALGAALAWRAANRAATAARVTLVMVPTDAFDPTPEALRRWGAAVAATRRRRDWLVRRATAVRFRLTGPAGGRVALSVTAPGWAIPVLEAACPHQCELERVESDHSGEPAGSTSPWARGKVSPARTRTRPLSGRVLRSEVARAELVLTSARHPLAVLDLAPDPLMPLVSALGDLAGGESAEVCIDVLPLSARQRRADRRIAFRGERAGAGGGRSFAEDLVAEVMGKNGGKSSPRSGSVLERMEDRAVSKARHGRLAPAEPGFSVQVLVAATGPRSRAMVATLAAGFSPAADRGAWRRAGVGPWLWGGADSAGRRRFFDRRLEAGWFRPRRSNVVGVGEIAGWIKPPSRHCGAANALRSGGLVPPPPAGLPTWEPGAEGLWPLGVITERSVKRIVGVPIEECLFTLAVGNAGAGKTAPALVRMVALARQQGTGAGCAGRPGLLYIDPHSDGIEALRGHLVAQADRIIEFDLSRDDSASQGAWNPLDMTGATEAEIGRRVSLFTAAYSTLVMSRGLTLLTKAITALCELNLQLPPALQATMFQIPTLLTDEGWRKAVVPFLSTSSAQFWAEGGRLARQSGGIEATGPVTNPIDRLRSSRSAAALFGQSRSSFDMRRAMDDGSIVLVCPGLGEDKDTLVMGLFLFGLHLAARSRRAIPVDQRRPFHAWCDEMQIADRGEGSAVIAQMVQEDRKFGLRFNGLVQQPTSLRSETLSAVLTNRSHLMTSAVGYESASVLAKEMGGNVEPGVYTHLAKYAHVASVTHQGKRSAPFRLGGLYLDDVYGPPAGAVALAAMETVIDASMRRRSTSEVLAELDSLDGRILEALRSRGPAPSGTVPAPVRGRRFSVVEPAGRGWSAG